MSRFDAVIFDLFGTLVPKWSRVRALANNALMAGELEVDPDRFQSAWDTTFRDRETGRLESVEAALRNIHPQLGIEIDEERIRSAGVLRYDLHVERIRPRDDVEATLAELRRRGLAVGLLSNISPPGPRVFRELDVCRHFDSVVFSSDEGIEKPDPAIYAVSVEQLRVAPERCLFIGDGGNRELTGARKAGMATAWIRVDAEIQEEGWLEDAAEWDGDTITTVAGVLELL